MQAPLRRVHARVWPVLTVLLALALALGHAWKQERPVEPGAVVDGAGQ